MVQALTRIRSRADYTAGEREFSQTLSRLLRELLEGQRNRLPLLRKYPKDPTRIAVIPMPDARSLEGVDLGRLEQLTWQTVRFLQLASATGGPIAQSIAPDGAVVEAQTFPTRYPDIVIERIDRFPCGAHEPDAITWSVYRVAESHTGIGRAVDAMRLLLSLVDFAR